MDRQLWLSLGSTLDLPGELVGSLDRRLQHVGAFAAGEPAAALSAAGSGPAAGEASPGSRRARRRTGMEEVESSLGLVRALWVSVPPGVGGSFLWV